MLASGDISDIALLFVTNEDFDTQLNRALALIGKRLQVSRSYLFIDSGDGTTTSNTHEWCAEGVESQIKNLQRIAYSEIPSWKKILLNQSVFSVEDVSKLPEDVKVVVEPQGIRSLVFSPLRIGEGLIGFLGFDECRHSRAWTEVEIEALKTITGIISAAYSRKLLTERLEAQQTRLTNIIEGTRLGTWEWNIQTGETIFNERWAEIIGYTLAELSPISIQTWERFAHPDDLEESGRQLNHHFQGISDFYECECRMRHKNGSWVWVLDRGKVIERDLHGRPLKMYGTHSDITEKKAMEEQIRDLAIRDPLTGLYNRRYIFKRLDEIIAEYVRCKRNFCLSIVDIDHFKEVNDSFGHMAGDYVLKEFALTISSTIRQYDLIGRYGGEEFIVLTTSAKGSETASMIERVMVMVRGSEFIFKGQKIRFTFSCGVADSSEFADDEVSVESLIALADKRLYSAKEAGRNCCFFR